MTVPVSSLSVAVQGVADFLDSQFGEDVAVSVNTPQRASELVKGSDKHFLNLFVYRVAPSGFHADTMADEATFIRINVLITAFPTDLGDVAADADLRVLGEVIRILNSRPVIPGVLPGAAGPAPDFRSDPHFDYRLQAVLQTPTMEELNHIWTTQGGDLAYRLSAAYEFALIPIEPLERHEEPVPMTTAVLDLSPDTAAAGAPGFIAYGEDATALPVGGIGAGNPPAPVNWLPVLLLVDNGVMSNELNVAGGTASVQVAIAGAPAERVALEVAWVRDDGTEVTQPAQVFTVTTHRIDDPAAVHALTLTNAQAGDTAVVLTRPVDVADQPLPISPFANTLTVHVGAP